MGRAGGRRLISVVGAGGFIGRRVVETLARAGADHQAVTGVPPTDRALGTVVWCRGSTPGSRGHSSRAVIATHLDELVQVLDAGAAERLVYLSSIAMYRLMPSPVLETDPVRLDPAHPLDGYALVKAMAEAALHQWGGPAVILRLAKVVGDEPGRGDLLDQLLTASVRRTPMTLRDSLSSAKDYLAVDDAVTAIVTACTVTDSTTINVGTGRNTSNAELVAALGALGPLEVDVTDAAPELVYGAPDVSRARALLGSEPTPVTELLPELRARWASCLA